MLKKSWLPLLLSLLSFQWGIAETAFVTDSLEITFRSAPSTTSKVLGMLQSGDEMTILSRGNSWNQVRLKKNGRVGFVLDQYLMERPAYAISVDSLRSRSDSLQEIKAQYETASQTLQTLEENHLSLMGDYQVAKASSQRDWMMLGATLLATGFILGFFLGRREKRVRNRYR